jgi:hypothetical protein
MLLLPLMSPSMPQVKPEPLSPSVPLLPASDAILQSTVGTVLLRVSAGGVVDSAARRWEGALGWRGSCGGGGEEEWQEQEWSGQCLRDSKCHLRYVHGWLEEWHDMCTQARSS